MFRTELDFQRRDGRTSRLPKARNQSEKKGSNKNNAGEGGLHVGMVWTRSTYGGLTDGLSEKDLVIGRKTTMRTTRYKVG